MAQRIIRPKADDVGGLVSLGTPAPGRGRRLDAAHDQRGGIEQRAIPVEAMRSKRRGAGHGAGLSSGFAVVRRWRGGTALACNGVIRSPLAGWSKASSAGDAGTCRQSALRHGLAARQARLNSKSPYLGSPTMTGGRRCARCTRIWVRAAGLELTSSSVKPGPAVGRRTSVMDRVWPSACAGGHRTRRSPSASTSCAAAGR